MASEPAAEIAAALADYQATSRRIAALEADLRRQIRRLFGL
jgi:hypothetical protein